MLTRLKQKFQSEENRKLLSNFFSLFVLQGANYILPLITIPYLVRVIGPEKFGLLGFATATVGYFALLISFGFSLSATRQIAVVKNDKTKVSQIFSAVISSQILFSLISLIMLTGLILSFQKFQDDWIIYYIIFSVSFSNIFLPMWFFQGMEKMKFITYLSIFSKLIFTIAIFVFVQEEKDFYLVPLFTFLGTVSSGVIAMWLIYHIFKVKYAVPSLENIIYQINESKHIFLSSVAGSSYTISITFILGLMTNNTVVGYFTAADKIIKALQGLFQPVITTLYPHINHLISSDKKKAIVFLKTTMYSIGTVFFFLSLLLFMFAKEITLLILGEQYLESIVLIQIMSLVPFLVAIGSVFAVLTMISFGRSKQLSKIYLQTAIVSLIVTIFLIYTLDGIGASFAVVFAEIIATLLMVRYLKKSDIEII